MFVNGTAQKIMESGGNGEMLKLLARGDEELVDSLCLIMRMKAGVERTICAFDFELMAFVISFPRPMKLDQKRKVLELADSSKLQISI